MRRSNLHAKQNLYKNLKNLKKVSKYLICYGFKKIILVCINSVLCRENSFCKHTLRNASEKKKY